MNAIIDLLGTYTRAIEDHARLTSKTECTATEAKNLVELSARRADAAAKLVNLIQAQTTFVSQTVEALSTVVLEMLDVCDRMGVKGYEAELQLIRSTALAMRDRIRLKEPIRDPQTAIDYDLYPASARPSGLHVPQFTEEVERLAKRARGEQE